MGVGRRGGTHSYGIQSDSSLLCWGRNDSGQLGTLDRVDRNVPTEAPAFIGWEQVAAGG